MATKLSSVIGAPFSPYVLTQLANRAYRSSTGTSTLGNRTNEEVLYLANKTSWVRLVSSVDIVLPAELSTDGGQTSITCPDFNIFLRKFGIEGSGDYNAPYSLAKNWILEAGTSTQVGNGINLRQGIGPNGAYGLGGTEELGYRPMPGLTSVTVETMGRLGSLRQATISFKAWNMNQLNVIEALYFRLGYSMLLEWGHTQYFNNKDSNRIEQPGGVWTSKDIFGIEAPFADYQTKESLQQAIAIKQENTSGNYDGMLGVVSNFNWSFNQEGGYDCTVRLVGLGSVLDSLRINQAYKLPEGLAKRLQTAQDTLDAFIAKQQQEIKRLQDEKAKKKEEEANATLDPPPKDKIDLQNLEIKYDNFEPTDEVTISTQYGAYSAKVFAGRSQTANFYDYFASFAGTGGNSSFVTATQNAYGGLWLATNGKFTRTEPLRGTETVNLDREVLKGFADNVKVKDYKDTNFFGVTSTKLINQVSYVTEKQDTFAALFDYATARYEDVSQGSGASNAYGADVPVPVYPSYTDRLSDKTTDFDYDVSFSFGGDNEDVYLEVGWSLVPALSKTENDFIPTRKEFVQSVKDWLSTGGNPVATLTSITFKKGDDFAKIKGTFQTDIKVYYKNAQNPNPDPSTIAKLKKVRPEIYGAGTANDPLYVVFKGVFTFETNNPGFIARVQSPPPNQTQSEQKPENANTGDDNGQVNTVDASQSESSTGYESALHAMLTTIQTTSQQYAITSNERVDIYDTTKDTEFFYKDGILNGVFNTVPVDNPANVPFNLIAYAQKGFNSELMVDPRKFSQIPSIDFKKFCKSVIVEFAQFNTDGVVYPGQYSVYITLGYLLAFINNMCLFYDSKDPNKDAKKRPYVYIDFNPETNLCLTSPQQFSIDPNICLIPAYLNRQQYREIFPTGIQPKEPFNPESENYLSFRLTSDGNGGVADFSFQAANRYQGKTMNILLNTQYLLEVLKSFTASDPEHSVNLQPFLERIMTDVNKCLGNVNLFRVTYRDDSNTIQIIDDQFTPEIGTEPTMLNRADFLSNLKKNAVEAGELPIFASTVITEGGKPKTVPSLSIARSFQIGSVMSTKLASMIAISAQASTGSVNAKDHSSLSYLNQNYRDRYKPYIQDVNPPTNGTNQKPNNDQEAADLFNAHVKSIYTILNLSADKIQSSKNYYIERMSKVKSQDTVTSSAPFIPVELELSLDGISGIKLMSAFSIPQSRLPFSLRNETDDQAKVAFIVSGLTHTVESNQWITRIKAQMIKLRADSTIGKKLPPAGKQLGVLPQTVGAPTSTVDFDDPNNPCYTPPFVLNPDRKVFVDLKTNRGKALQEYRKAFPAGQSKGLQALLEAQVWVEGFEPGSVAYRTNNPGNIGTNTNVGAGNIGTYKTLTEGIQAQINLVKRIINGDNRNYPTNPDLYTYLTRYAPPCFRVKATGLLAKGKDDPSAYTNTVLAYFRAQGLTTATANMKLSEIIAITG